MITLLPYQFGPYIRTLKLARDTRILLCAYGLTDDLDDDQIAQLVTSASPAVGLLNAALENGGRDNVTAVVIEIT